MVNQIFDIKTFKKVMEFKGVESDDALLTIMEFVKKRLENFLSKRLDYAIYTERYRGSGCNVPLMANPIDEEASILVTRQPKNYDASETGEYVVTPWGIELNTEIYRGEVIRVTYSGGYPVYSGTTILDFSADPEAGAIVRAAMLQTMHEWQRRLKPGGTELNTDVGTLSMEPIDLLQEVKDSLESFRHPSVRWLW